MFFGIQCGLSSNLIWRLAFLIPVLVPDSDSVALALGRYLAFGVLSAGILIARRGAGISGLSRRIWGTALLFAFAGHLGYYFFLGQAITLAGAPIVVANSGFLRRHPEISASTWSTLMGVGALVMLKVLAL